METEMKADGDIVILTWMQMEMENDTRMDNGMVANYDNNKNKNTKTDMETESN